MAEKMSPRRWFPSVPLVMAALYLLCGYVYCGTSCGANWLRFGDRCFRFYPMRLRGHIARLRCILEGSDLASISDDSILHFIAQHASHEEGYRFWVGLERNPDTGNLTWLDGTGNPEEEPWVRKPDVRELSPDSVSSGFACFAYNGALVVKVSCNERLGLICGHSIANRRNRTVCNALVDPVHSFVGEATGNCLFKAPGKSTKDGAEELCQHYGGHFTDLDAMMKDGLTAFREHQVLSNDGSRFWTGFTWNGTGMFWRFGNTVFKDYPISVIRDRGSCITMQFNFTDILQTHFYQTECHDRANVVCSQNIGETLDAESPYDRPQMDSPELKCPEGYVWKGDSRNNYCYWETSFETQRLSWTDAEAFCQIYGGHLASFHSVHEEKVGLSIQYGRMAHPFWIGLSLDVDTNTYVWIDGSPLDYNNWAPGQPDNREKRLRCVAMEAQQKHWVSSLCVIPSWFICKVPKRARHYTLHQPVSVTLETCDQGKASYRFQEACYVAVNDNASWHQAKQHCENEGASLVSIHTEDEIGFLLRLLYYTSKKQNRVWIGLNSFGSDGAFRWTDWSPLDFTFFSERNTSQHQEKCYNMYIQNGQWNNENCDAAMGFVCKWASESSTVPEVTSTPDPKIENCKKGWMAHDDRCYYFGGKRVKDRVNWTQAARFCRDAGGDLTSIRSDKEQAFLSSMLQSLQVDVWIGFHDKIHTERYYWLDNSEVKYTNWAVGESSSHGITEYCVKMVYDYSDSGIWKDDDCDSNYGFICQTRRVLCYQPCQNGGSCGEGNQCVCPAGFDGDRCENDICKVPPSPRNGNIICLNFTNDRIRTMCTAECEEGYQFPNGENEAIHACDLRDKAWRPRYEFPDCKAICNPPCPNAGTCGEGHQCVCPNGFDGERCKNAIHCQDPGTPENGVRISSHYPVGSRIRFSCNADYELKGAEEILCRANGQWEGELTTCDLPEYSQCGLGKENVGVASPRIVGGQLVTEPWPWMAALYIKMSKENTEKKLQCGGSLIHPYFILTAGHCIDQWTGLREASDITVKLGQIHVNDTEHVQQLEVRKVYVHDKFSRLTYDYDAALLELKEPVQYNTRIFPICLPPKDIPADSTFLKPHSKVWTAGWGSVEMRRKFDWIPSQISDVLKEIQLDIQPRETCLKSLEGNNGIFTDRMFCAGTGGAMNDTCHGDSGGPVMQRRLDEVGNKSWTQVGIVSWGVGCGLRSEFGMYSALHQLMPWIDETIGKAEEWMG